MAHQLDSSTADSSDTDGSWQADGLLGGVAFMLVLAVVQRGTGFVRNIMVCRLLEPDQLGSWNLANSFLLLAAPLVVLGIPGSFVRYVEHYRQQGRLHTFLSRTLVLTAVLAFGGSFLLLFNRDFAAWLTFGDSQAAGLFATCAITLIFVVGFNVCIELLLALRQVKLVSYLHFANSLLFTLISLVLVGLVNLRAKGVVIGYAIACLVTSLVAGWMVLQRVRSVPADRPGATQHPFWSKLLTFAFWFWLSDLMMNLFFVIDRYMIVHCSGASPTESLTMIGQYHSSQIIGVLLMALTGMLGSVLLSYLSHDWEAGRRDEARKSLDFALKTIALALTAIAAVALLVAPAIFGWALANKYSEGFRVLPMTMTYCIWFGLLPVAKNYLWCREKAWLASVAVIVGLVINVALNFLWLPMWGLSGAVLATTVANSVALLLVYLLTYRLGMRYSRGTLLATMMPLWLCLGPLPAFAALIAVVGTGWTGGWLFEEHEQDRILELAEPALARLGWKSSWAVS